MAAIPGYVDLDTIHRPSNGATAPATWGDQINDDFTAIDTFLTAAQPVGRIYIANGASLTVAGSPQALPMNGNAIMQGGMALTSGALVVPTAGVYVVTSQLRAFGVAGGAWLNTYIFQNNAVVSSGSRSSCTDNTADMAAQACDMVACNAGDQLQVGYRVSAATTLDNSAAITSNFLAAGLLFQTS